MAIVKLGNVSVINIGLTPSTFNKDFWNIKNQILFPFIKGSLNIEGYITQKAISSNSAKLADKNTIILSIFGKFESIWLNEKVSFNQQTANIYSNNNEILINKYLYYWLIKKKEILTLNSIGTVAKHLNKSILSNISIFIPNVDIQNKIISIIEPFEKLNQSITSFLKILKIIIRNISLLDSTKIIDTFYNLEIRFIKGILPQSEWFSNLKSKIPFINVACINNNPNKFIKNQFINEINVYYGDIILSLDATIGLVNNFLYGINGYGYKIKSEKWPNYLIYFSLLTNINQDIIKKHAKGTTILHASEAKKFICLLDNEKFNQIIRTLFELDLYFKKIKNALEKIINNLIKYLII